jgi:hypothetical protein
VALPVQVPPGLRAGGPPAPGLRNFVASFVERSCSEERSIDKAPDKAPDKDGGSFLMLGFIWRHSARGVTDS